MVEENRYLEAQQPCSCFGSSTVCFSSISRIKGGTQWTKSMSQILYESKENLWRKVVFWNLLKFALFSMIDAYLDPIINHYVGAMEVYGWAKFHNTKKWASEVRGELLICDHLLIFGLSCHPIPAVAWVSREAPLTGLSSFVFGDSWRKTYEKILTYRWR